MPVIHSIASVREFVPSVHFVPVAGELFRSGEKESVESEMIAVQIHDFVVGNFLFNSGDIADNASLMDEGVIDSIGVLELVMFVEESFGIVVSDDDVIPENFDSIIALVRYVNRKLDEANVALAI